MNILITSIGRRVSLLRAFQKELKKRFPDSIVFAADANPHLSAACQVAEAFIQVPLVNDLNYIPFLIEKCKELEIRVIIPTIDTELEVISKSINHLQDSGIQPIISNYDFISKCRNKRVIHKFFEEQEIQVAKEFPKNDYQLPIFIKPVDGSRSIDTFIIRKEEEFTEIHFTNDKLMFLEYLDHSDFEEFTCDLYYDKNSILRCVVPRKRIEVRSGEVNKGLTVNNNIIPLIRSCLGEISGARGCLTTQFFRHKKSGKIYGIEINARFGGGFPLSYLAGANFPEWIIKEYMMNESVDDQFDCWEPNLLMIRYDDEILVHGYKD